MSYNDIFSAARRAAIAMVQHDEQKINQVLAHAAQAIRHGEQEILAANELDLAAMEKDNPLYDRLKLTPQRIESIADDMLRITKLNSPQGRVIESWERPNAMRISKVAVPFGVVGIICEARPNVTIDVFSLCIKTANACIVKGGRDARHSNEAIAAILRGVLREQGLDENSFTLMASEQEATAAMLNAEGYIDVIIPRGGKGLIRFVRENARVPVIETGAGIVHTYYDKGADLQKGIRIITNGKTRRVSVCNALDCLIIHRERINDLCELCRQLAQSNVKIFADKQAFDALQDNYPSELLAKAEPEHFGTEFLDYKMAIRTVDSIDEAIAHIERYSSRHSEAIVTEESAAAQRFQREVDAACVYVNLPTSFTDGGEFGFGAEIGISTQKLHARGPMGLRELTTYKYIIEGEGQTRD